MHLKGIKYLVSCGISYIYTFFSPFQIKTNR